MSEMRGFVISRMRRRVGVAAVRAMARHRLLRVPFVGASHAAVAARGTARQQGGGGRRGAQPRRSGSRTTSSHMGGVWGRTSAGEEGAC